MEADVKLGLGVHREVTQMQWQRPRQGMCHLQYLLWTLPCYLMLSLCSHTTLQNYLMALACSTADVNAAFAMLNSVLAAPP